MSFRHGQILRATGFIVVLSSLSSVAAAQTPVSGADSRVTIGLKAGLNYSELKIEDDSLPLKPILDPVGGVYVARNLSPNLGIQVEALLGRKGAQDDDDPAEGRYRFTYIDVPLTVSLGSGPGRRAQFRVFTGPQASFLLGADEVNFRLDVSRDISDEVKTVDFGWTVGAGVSMQRLSLDARYTHGLININTAGGSWVKQRTATVLMGFRLR
jgi:hypothetical protein